MANASGRPTAPLVLSSDERDYLERQVRRHRVARSMSERCRIILRCGDGLPSKVVAVELGVHEHTVGKWRRRFLKDRIEGLLDEARPGRPRTIEALRRELSEETGIEIRGKPRLHGIFSNFDRSKGDHIAVFVVQGWERVREPPAKLEIIEQKF